MLLIVVRAWWYFLVIRPPFLSFLNGNYEKCIEPIYYVKYIENM